MPKPTSYLDEFDPNAMPEPYATYTHGRTPHFKLHRRLGDATSAAQRFRRYGSILYERRGDRWVQLARFEVNYGIRPHPDGSPLPDNCENCGATTLCQNLNNRLFRDGEQVFKRTNGRGSPLVKPLEVLYLCGNCIRVLGYR